MQCCARYYLQDNICVFKIQYILYLQNTFTTTLTKGKMLLEDNFPKILFTQKTINLTDYFFIVYCRCMSCGDMSFTVCVFVFFFFFVC